MRYFEILYYLYDMNKGDELRCHEDFVKLSDLVISNYMRFLEYYF